jgi:hypothetical protein
MFEDKNTEQLSERECLQAILEEIRLLRELLEKLNK